MRVGLLIKVLQKIPPDHRVVCIDGTRFLPSGGVQLFEIEGVHQYSDFHLCSLTLLEKNGGLESYEEYNKKSKLEEEQKK